MMTHRTSFLILAALLYTSPLIAQEKVDYDALYADEEDFDETYAESEEQSETQPDELGQLRAEVEALRSEVEANAAAAEVREAEREAQRARDERLFQIYGFVEAGISKIFLASDTTPLTIFINDNANFALGNVNLYFDARPADGWRSLVETRFTLYPNGREVPEGFDIVKIDNRVFDTTNSSGRSRVIWGSVVLERAWIEHTFRNWLALRVGYFLTPYGIWNVDHGSPTLISLLLPNFQISEALPNRLAGALVYGTLDWLPWQLKYYLHVSNGRQIDPFADDDDGKAVGGRVEIARRTADWGMAFGASKYRGSTTSFTKTLRFKDGALDGFDRTYDYDYDEWAGGLDFSLDIGNFRLRAEYMSNGVNYNEGRHEKLLGAPGRFKPNRIEHDIYGLVAYRFGWLEPYAYVEHSYTPDAGETGDFFNFYSGGFNLHFHPRVGLNTQYAYIEFGEEFEGKYDVAPSESNIQLLTSRLVLAF